MFCSILDAIDSYESIVIYRHLNPDGDAFGAQFGLTQWIKDNYPNKTVIAFGKDQDRHHYFPLCDVNDDIDWSNTLAIVVDCANRERLDDEKTFDQCAMSIKIDHHPNVDPFCQTNYVDTASAATCQILMEMFQQAKLMISVQTATYLAYGIVTDSVNFSAAYTSVNTLTAYTKCMEAGLDHVELFKNTSQLPLNEYNGITYLRSKVNVSNGVAYCIIKQEDVLANGFSMEQLKDHVNVMKGIEGVEVWGLFYEIEDHKYRVSLRSYRVNINPIALRHHGGGHQQASGCNASNEKEIQCIVDELIQAVNIHKNAEII